MADNPFNDNPFTTNQGNGATPANAASGPWNANATNGAWATSAPSASGPSWGAGVSSNAFSPPVTDNIVPAAGAKLTEKDLAKREADLNRREAELKRLETELRNAGGKPKNWPPYCSFTYHDINGEIPEPSKGMVRAAYWCYLGLVVCLFFNFVGTAACLIGIGGNKLSTFLWGGLYLIGGAPGAWWLWYRRLYSAAIKDSAFQYAVFFAFFMAQLIFVGWSAIAPPILNSSSHTGFWEAINIIGTNTGVGVMYFIGAALWSLEFLWSFWVLKMVYSRFRGGGHTVRSVRNDAAMQGVQGPWATRA